MKLKPIEASEEKKDLNFSDPLKLMRDTHTHTHSSHPPSAPGMQVSMETSLSSSPQPITSPQEVQRWPMGDQLQVIYNLRV